MSEIQELKKEEKKHVSWTIFVWSLGIILGLFGMVFNQLSKAQESLEATTYSNNEIKVQLSQIQADLVWIKLQLSK